ncbi:MAG TPA: zinc-ribbon domain-containing protein [Armatimonadota bacterium]|nr:zinc-ribbon domain-containing protein [Armatimonadota bacterium]
MAADKILRCRECNQQFVFTVGEQEFYAQKGFQNEPGRCGPCRKARKRERALNSGVQFRDSQPLRGTAVRQDYDRGLY